MCMCVISVVCPLVCTCTCVHVYMCLCLHMCVSKVHSSTFLPQQSLPIPSSPSSGKFSATFCLRPDILGISYKRIRQFVTGFLHVEYWCVCVYVSVYVCVWCVHMDRCAPACRPESTLRYGSSCLCWFGQSLSLPWDSPSKLVWPAREPQDATSPVLGLQIHASASDFFVFCVGSGELNLEFMLIRQ